MTNKTLLNAILDEDSSSIMDIFDQMMIQKIGLIVEDRKHNIANSLILEAGRADDDEENFDFDDDSLDWDKEHFDDPLNDDEDDSELTDDDSESDEDDGEMTVETGGE